MEELRQLVIIDTENSFLKDMEEEIIRRYADKTRIQILTEKNYTKEYLMEERHIDVLVVAGQDYEDDLQKHQIGRILLLKEEIGADKVYPDNVEVLLQFLPTEDFFHKLEEAFVSADGSESSEKPEENPREVRVIAVYSPIGGCGKSLVAYALAKKLKKLDQKVLLVGCDPTQSVNVYYPSETYAKEDLAEKLIHPGEDTYWTILQNIEQDDISYLLPFEKNLPSLDVGMEEWKVLLSVLKENRDFDWIVLDVGSVLDRKMGALMTKIDYLILLTETNQIANRKMQKLLRDPDLLPKCECFLVANEYRTDGMRIASESVFGVISPYASWEEAVEDPVFYQIALKVTG